jgi:putative membrane protein insertion efficiency factor
MPASQNLKLHRNKDTTAAMDFDRLLAFAGRVPRRAGRGLVKAYRYTLSPLIGYDCRHLPTCSHYADEAIERHGLWAGGWMTLGRLCRCHPFGTSGLDFVPQKQPPRSRWYLPWRYARWRGVNDSAT